VVEIPRSRQLSSHLIAISTSPTSLNDQDEIKGVTHERRRHLHNSVAVHMTRIEDKPFTGVPHAYRIYREDKHQQYNKSHNYKGERKGGRRGSGGGSSGGGRGRQTNYSHYSMDKRRSVRSRDGRDFYGGLGGGGGDRENSKNNSESFSASSRKKIESLEKLAFEVRKLMETYEEALGTSIMDNETRKEVERTTRGKGNVRSKYTSILPPRPSKKSSHDTTKTGVSDERDNGSYPSPKAEMETEMEAKLTTSLKLIETEDVYRQICIKLRQLIAGWTWIRPFPRNRLRWSEDMKRNTLPPVMAGKVIQQLEALRRQRAFLISNLMEEEQKSSKSTIGGTSADKDKSSPMSQITSTESGMFQWISDQFSSSSVENVSDENDEAKHASTKTPAALSPDSLSQLTAHVSPDFTATTQLYNEILSVHGFWRDRIPRDTFPTQIEEVVRQMNHNYYGTNGSAVYVSGSGDGGEENEFGFDRNPNVKPDESVYRFLITSHQHTKVLDDAMKSARILNLMLADSNGDVSVRMEESKNDESNFDSLVSPCQPTRKTFVAVLAGFLDCDSVQQEQASDDNRRIRIAAIKEAYKVLDLMEKNLPNSVDALPTHHHDHNSDSSGPNDESETIGDRLKPYQSVLRMISLVGLDKQADYFFNLQELLTKMVGKEYRSYLLSPNQSKMIIDTSKITPLIMHDFVHAFSIAKGRKSLETSKLLLEKMEKTRAEFLKEDGKAKGLGWNPHFPSQSTYNAVIMGHFYDDYGGGTRTKSASKEVKTMILNDANYTSGLLDAMLQHEPSLPQHYTYTRLLRIWNNSLSTEAGPKGEEIISRLEMCAIFSKMSSKELEFRLKQWQAALECWAVSASAGRPGSARSAFRFFERLNERLNHELGGPNSSSSKRQNKIFFYNAVLKACSDTIVSSDKSEAMEIAFEMYNRISDENIVPTSSTFVSLLRCCQLLPPASRDQVMTLSREIFIAACSNGCVSSHVLFVLSHVNRSLYDAYEKKPEHSEGVAGRKRHNSSNA